MDDGDIRRMIEALRVETSSPAITLVTLGLTFSTSTGDGSATVNIMPSAR
jgi:hypothetical protein